MGAISTEVAGWIQLLIQCGALGLVALFVKWLLASQAAERVQVLRAFGSELQRQREHDGRKTDQVVQAIDKQTLSFRLDIEQLRAAIAAGSCKAHLAAQTNARQTDDRA